MKKVEFKKSFKKQMQILIGGFIFILVILPFLLSKTQTIERMLLAGSIIVMIGLLMMYLVKKSAKEVMCPHCQKDLFELIQVPKNNNNKIKFCPYCGNEIEI